MEGPILTPCELANRWKMQSKTLSQWRWSGRGPIYIKMGGNIRYRLSDIEEFEKQKVRHSTSQVLDEKLKQESDQITYLKVCKS